MTTKSLLHSSLLDNQYYTSMLVGNDAFVPPTFELLETYTLTSSASSFEITNVNNYSDYENLQIRTVLRSGRSFEVSGVLMRFNNDSGSNYTGHYIRGNGSNTLTFDNGGSSGIWDGEYAVTGQVAPAGTFGGGIWDIYDAFNSNKYTTAKVFGHAMYGPSGGHAALFSGVWQNTASLTSISLVSTNDSFLTGSSVSIYGMR